MLGYMITSIVVLLTLVIVFYPSNPSGMPEVNRKDHEIKANFIDTYDLSIDKVSVIGLL